MDEIRYEKVAEVNGRGEAEVIESFLQAEGFLVELIQDSVSHSSYVTPWAMVQVFVPKKQAARARELLKPFNVLPEVDSEDAGDE
jgi:hypothetical protein